MRILITGVAGFVGSSVAQRLLATGHTVIGVDAFIPNYARSLKERNIADCLINERFELHELDLRTDHIAPLLDNVEAIIHEAGLPGLPTSWTHFQEYMTCNLLATQRLLEACRDGQLRRFIHISSSSVYGALAIGDETQPTQPVSPYGVTKLAAEQLVLAYARTGGVPASVLRYYSIYGPRQRPDMAYNIFIDNLLRDEPITILGDGHQARSNAYIDDCVQATIQALDGAADGEVYNIGGGRVITIHEAIGIIAEALGVKPRLVFAPPRPGDQRRTEADIRKATRAFGYEPCIAPEEGLYHQVAWQRQAFEAER
jgi:nucleoside-diphosphate-sugar epimerase